MRKQRALLLVASLAVMALTLGLRPDFISYPIAYWQYERLVSRRPASRTELEGRLWWFSGSAFSCAESAWTSIRSEKAAVTCERYLILGKEPIEVSYDSEGKVVAIFPSFE